VGWLNIYRKKQTYSLLAKDKTLKLIDLKCKLQKSCIKSSILELCDLYYKKFTTLIYIGPEAS
jgi:hypothetical protein